VGTNRRYAEQIDRRMDERISQREAEWAMVGEPETLFEQELELDTETLLRPDRAIAVRAWVRYGGTPVSVSAEAVAWTSRAVAVRWKTPGGDVHRAWVWASAIRRG
jgi:hypothetical protein